MATKLTPYVSFRGNARQAMEFYQQVFGGELASNTFAEFGQADTDFADQIMHAQLETAEGFTLMLSDVPPMMDLEPGATVRLTLHGDDEQRMRGYWDQLSAGGSVQVPLEPQMWGDIYGQCTDQFGIEWMFNIAAAT